MTLRSPDLAYRADSKMATQKPVAGKRKRGATVKTGCNVCKQRHLKCDEEKPQCRRCRMARFECSGHHYGQLKSQSLIQMSTSPASERSLLYYFRSHALDQLSGNFDEVFWNRLVLQRSHVEPAIHHALVAFTSFHRHFYERGTLDSVMTFNSVMTYEKFALYHYSKAMESASLKIGQQGLQAAETILTCSVLFMALESLRGSPDAALVHLENGISILNEQQPQSSISIDHRCVQDLLIRLDIQATTYLDNRPPRIKLRSQPASEGSRTYQDARASLDWLGHQILSRITSPASDSLESELPLFVRKLEKWNIWFQDLERKPTLVRTSMLLEIQYRALLLMLKLRMFGMHDSGNNCLFGEIIDIAKAYVSPHKPTTMTGHEPGTFTLDMDIVAPLYFMAMLCSDPSLRSEAIGLLYESPRHEGLWQGRLAADVASRVDLPPAYPMHRSSPRTIGEGSIRKIAERLNIATIGSSSTVTRNPINI